MQRLGNVVLWDLDNCISEDKWRTRYINHGLADDEGKWVTYNEHLLFDPVGHAAEFKVLQKISQPIFLTGRSEALRAQTGEWLKYMLGLESPIVYMRPADQPSTPPAILKEILLQLVLRWIPRDRIIAAFDDLPCVIEMYRKYGIEAHQLAIHDPLTLYLPSQETCK